MAIRTNRKDAIFCLVFILIALQGVFGKVFTYTEEIIAILGFFCLLIADFSFIPKNIRQNIKWWYRCLILIILMGFLSSIISKIQPFGIIWIYDLFNMLKCFLVFIYVYKLLQRCDTERIIKMLYKGLKIYIVLGFIFCLINLYTDSFTTLYNSIEMRYGLRAYKFIHHDSGEYSTLLTIVIVLLMICKTKLKVSNWLFFMVISCMLATLRGKAFAMLALFISIYIVIRQAGRLSFRNIVIVGLLAVFASFSQLETYFLGEEATPRSLLLVYGVITANDYFPLGAGFGSYGSNMAKVHYSKLYTEYGFDNMYGMNQDSDINCLNDNFWPMIMGQFGWIGTVFYGLIILNLFLIIRKFIKNKELQIAAYLLFFLLVYSSSGGPVFVNNLGCSVLIIFALTLECSKRYSHEKNLCNNNLYGKTPKLL